MSLIRYNGCRGVSFVWTLNYDQLVALSKTEHGEKGGRPPRRDLLQLAIAILRDECPPDTTMYLCERSEEYDDEICVRCWTTYLFWAANGYREADRPYKESNL